MAALHPSRLTYSRIQRAKVMILPGGGLDNPDFSVDLSFLPPIPTPRDFEYEKKTLEEIKQKKLKAMTEQQARHERLEKKSEKEKKRFAKMLEDEEKKKQQQVEEEQMLEIQRLAAEFDQKEIEDQKAKEAEEKEKKRQQEAVAAAAAEKKKSPLAALTRSQVDAVRNLQMITGSRNEEQLIMVLQVLEWDVERATTMWIDTNGNVSEILGRAYSDALPVAKAVVAPKVVAPKTKLTLILPNGSTQVHEFLQDDTLWIVYQYLYNNGVTGQNRIVRPNPYMIFTENKMNMSLKEAGLTPTGTLRIESI